MRKLKAKQLAQQKRLKVIQNKRIGTAGPPRIIVLVAMSSKVDLGEVQKKLIEAMELEEPITESSAHIGGVTAFIPRWKCRVTLFQVPNRDLIATMDIAKVADIVLFVMDPEDVRDDLAFKTISVIKAQGQPTVFGAIQGLEKLPQKQKNPLKKRAIAFFHTEFLNEPKVLPVDTNTEASQLLRFLCESKLSTIYWREARPHMLVDKIDFKSYNNGTEFGTLQVSGYLRGNSLNPNLVLHITGYGDAQIESIEYGDDPYTQKHRKKDMEGSKSVLSSEPEKLESLERENPPDPFAAEQTWPTPEEIAAAEKEMKEQRVVPKGTSEYQAAWIVDEDGTGGEGDEDGGDEMQDVGDEDGEDDGFDIDVDVDKVDVSQMVNRKRSNSTESNASKKVNDDSDSDMNDDDGEEGGDNDMVDDNDKEKKGLKEQDDEDLHFPDEVYTPVDKPARIHFQKYRGLKSFRTSPWDPKENLPHDYSRIFQFQNFKRTAKRVMNDVSGVEPDQYITIHIKNIHVSQFANHPKGHPLIVSGLIKYENKISVVNFSVTKTASLEEPIKSKTTLIFHVGFRRFQAQPIFSESGHNSDKFKYLKFLRGTSIATVFAPICFPPSTIVLTDTTDRLVATGSLHSVNPDRIVVKRIILTGIPYKVKKNVAHVKDMFFSPEDIRWFKPVELWTKHGRSGSITEPVGTHGHMKCTFDNNMGNQDTVCMSLYKRVFPNWATLPQLKTPDVENKDSNIV
eukprot:TRINITY_DN2458_c0_g1_i1.p1 TRINITY_DN2458_c0_g1~~TRINITY_DN2458_c0_g1_i1.p1  ORF type:complete len:796 (-),score=222.33 TRINITY_DN2458_c0_g1_i1:16-2226(-)